MLVPAPCLILNCTRASYSTSTSMKLKVLVSALTSLSTCYFVVGWRCKPLPAAAGDRRCGQVGWWGAGSSVELVFDGCSRLQSSEVEFPHSDQRTSHQPGHSHGHGFRAVHTNPFVDLQSSTKHSSKPAVARVKSEVAQHSRPPLDCIVGYPRSTRITHTSTT